MRASFLACTLALVAGCPGSSTTTDAGPDAPGLDAPALDTPALDVPGADVPGADVPGADAPVADAPTDDAPGAPDAPTGDAGPACTAAPIPDHIAGVCDGRGIAGCTMWAQRVGGAAAVARCVPPEGRCARADECGASGCTCGGGPECGDDQACVGQPGGGFACECLPGSACGGTPIPDHVAGVCDGIGRMGCTMWAQDNGGSMAVAQCVPPDGRCARANRCTADGCFCGSGPECGDDEMCVSGIVGFSCVCL